MATATLYGRVFLSLLNKEIDFDSDTIKVLLVGASYTFNKDTHRYKSDVTGEVTGTGYTAGGQALAGKTVTYNTGTDATVLDANDVVWAASTITATGAVIYDDTPATDATKPLIGWVDFAGSLASVDGSFTIAWNAAGIVSLTA